MTATVDEPDRRFKSVNIGNRKASFSDVEKYFLKALLIPAIPEERSNKTHLECISNFDVNKKTIPDRSCQKQLDDSVLFQLPFTEQSQSAAKPRIQFGRHEKKILGLWQAHSDDVHPKLMHKRKSSNQLPPAADIAKLRTSTSYGSGMDDSSKASVVSASGSVQSDVRVRQPEEHDENSSWGEDDGGFLHYDAWEVLGDEYAQEFGLDFSETPQSISATLADEDEDCQARVFKIIGTAADDTSAQPHVLSPPLMDSLLNFVPDSVSMENYWMKFSLIRDGASLYTLKQYLKASPMTLLAIETSKGDVFGSFTSQTWRNHPSFYGTAPAFLWRMRHNRRTPCHSLFEQAQMESEIDVYAYSGLNDLFQICDDHRLAIGGGKLVPDWQQVTSEDGGSDNESKKPGTVFANGGVSVESLDAGENFGFGIALDENLLGGTTSPCGTFRNPCLTNNLSKGEPFKVANIEAWTFTPCSDKASAERMELSKYFVQESIRSSSITSTNSSTYDVFASPFSSQEEFQQDFYRRLGHHEPNKQPRRDTFQYTSASRRS